MPVFEYYEPINYFKAYYYPYLTLFCQGFGFLLATLYHVTPYKCWNFMGFMIASLCLPVDVFIFWQEPLGRQYGKLK